MKTLIKSLLLIAVITYPAFSNAQSGNNPPLPQFLFPAFTKGVVKMKSGDNYTAVFNYNMVDEEMIFNNKGQYMALENINSVDTILIGTAKFVPVQKVFYEVIFKGNPSIYAQHKSKYAAEGTATAYGMKSPTNSSESFTSIRGGNQIRTLEIPDNVKVVPEDVFWVRVNDELKRFSTERQFIKLFPEKEAELKDYFKKNSIDFDKQQDLVKLGSYCNELLK